MAKVTTKAPATLFDHLKFITSNKKKWEDLSEVDKKSFSPYMINRYLSMNKDLTELINAFQHLTIGVMKPREVYKFYYDVLPKMSFYVKYVTGKKSNKFEPELVNLIKHHYSISLDEATEYLELYFMDETSMTKLINLITKDGKEEKEIKKMLKVK